jgi:hypothetical protein
MPRIKLFKRRFKMKLIFKLAVIAAMTFSISTNAKNETYGKTFKVDKTYSLDQLISKKIDNKTVTLKAKVVKVCKKKGCWMGLKVNDKDVRVTFEGYSFFVPMSLMNKEVALKGKLHEKTISKKVARHYLEDEGKSQEEINKITGDVKEYNFIASGVQVL